MNNISLTVSRCGIVELASYRNTPLKVNDQDMVSLFEEAMKIARVDPETDYNDRFAGRVTLTVEFIGDMKPDIPEAAMKNEEVSHEHQTD